MVFKDSDCTFGARVRKTVTVRLVPESEKQLAPGAVAFLNCWR